MTDNAEVLLRARYVQVPGSDPEYGQGAIERNELAHREIHPMVWLIAVPGPTDAAEWQQRLNASVDPEHGSFQVEAATEDERDSVRRGVITLQK